MENLISELFPGWQSLKVHPTALVFILAVTPGFVIVFVRSQLVSGRILPYPAGFLTVLNSFHNILGGVVPGRGCVDYVSFVVGRFNPECSQVVGFSRVSSSNCRCCYWSLFK